eukprot:TRINITY_DN123118_c0_g1_i1.p1 TRINITY_DN123118_c0_g1~~TRINITY_DN123118_c0_g1_i1.p1  ORF type:complete len:137 (-),score=15.99 TRINITY_DN123118_c0_g1_i1:100-510(-)
MVASHASNSAHAASLRKKDRDVPLAFVEECAGQYGWHAEELRKAIDSTSALMREGNTPDDLALAMRRAVLLQIYTDIRKDHRRLEEVISRRRHHAVSNVPEPLRWGKVKTQTTDSAEDADESPSSTSSSRSTLVGG